MSRMDILATREYDAGGQTKTAYTRIGTAFQTRNGGWSLIFDALPVNGKALLMEPKPRDEQPRAARSSQSGGHVPSTDEPIDDVPF